MHRAFARVSHRPWPLPARRWAWRQNWIDLLFAHYPVAASELRRLVPDGLNIQEFDGTSWIGVVPFRMTGVMRRPFPDLPWVSAFRELNVRLYVERDGKPGVWFLSLDATNAMAVWAARRFFHLPYHQARIEFSRKHDAFHYHSQRAVNAGDPHVTLRAVYRPTSPVRESKPGTLESFLTERYCLYSKSPDGRLFRSQVHHAPWPLQDAEAELDPAQLLKPHGLDVGNTRPVLHFSRGVDVVVWALESVDSGSQHSP
jgi:uncharacterized protein YqjF (DUF2071 family)